MANAVMKYETPVVFTSRETMRLVILAKLDDARSVSSARVRVAQRHRVRPDFVIGEGGIISSVVGAHECGVWRTMMLGQIHTGVPVWRLGEDRALPGLSYVVFPGKAGGSETLLDLGSYLLNDSSAH